ncbi:MAG: hypothetical protein JWP75_3325 [Frondihabitans sp.]|nr:hypothetical protein [Frondihabitans sp.]
MSSQQKFRFGYHLNTWDLAGESLATGLDIIRRNGFPFMEALARDDISRDYSRRFMGTGNRPVLMGTTDITFLSRVSAFARAAEKGLSVSSLYCNREFVNPLSWETELTTLDAILTVLQGFGAPGLVLGGGPKPPVGRDHDADLYSGLARSLKEVGVLAAERGMWVAYHPHIDTAIENRAQVDRLMNELGDGPAGLCVDIAHLAMTGSDPVAVIRDYASAVKYVHYKDVADQTGVQGADRFDTFQSLGTGIVDIPGVTDQLLANGYDGIAIIELDSSDQDPEEALQDSVAYIRSLGLVLDPSGSR